MVLYHRFLAPRVKRWRDQTKVTRKSSLKRGCFAFLGLDKEHSFLGSNSLSFEASLPFYEVRF